MNRRDLIRQAGLASVAAALWASLPVRTWAALVAPEGWNKEDEDFLSLIGDTIIPATSGAIGAGAIGIGRFIVTMTRECHEPAAGEALRRGLRELHALCREQFSREFAGISTAQRETVLTAYEKRASRETRGKAVNPFRLMKELTLLGYFTSEPGATQALRYDPVPGSYRGSVTLADGDRSWAL